MRLSRFEQGGRSREDDAAIFRETEAGIVCDFPRMTVWIAEHACVAAIEGFTWLVRDIGTIAARILDD